MSNIDLNKLNELIDSEISDNQAAIEHAAKKGWYDKAFMLSVKNEGLTKARFLANSGDCHTEKT